MRDAQVGLAGAGRSEQDDVLAAVEEVELAEVQHRLAAQRGLEGEVELLERLAGGEAGGLDARLAAVAVAAVDLGLEQRGGEALEGPFSCAGAVGEFGQRPRGRRRLEDPEQVRELRRRRGSCDQRVIDVQRPDLDLRAGVAPIVAAGPQGAGVLERGDCPVPRKDAAVPAGDLAGVQRDRRDLALIDASPRRAGRPARDRASSRWCRRADRDRARPASPTVWRSRASPPAAAPAALPASRSTGRSRRLLCVRPLALTNQASSWAWKSSSLANARPGSKLRLRVALQPLDRSLGLRVGRRAEAPADPAAGRRTRRTPRSGDRRGRGCRPGDPRAASAAAPPSRSKTARDTGEQILGSRREDQHPGAGSAIAQARDHDIAAAGLAVTDRHLLARLPDVELADLPGPPDRPPERPRRRREQRPHLAQVVIDDRLARPAAQRLKQLADPDPGQRRILAAAADGSPP